MNYGRVNSGSERLDAKLQQKTFTPDRFPFDKHATTYGIDGFSEVIINAPENFSAENIKKDVTIAGVTGTYEGTTPTPTQTKEVKATSFPTVVSPDSGYALSQATVTAPDNLVAENIKSGVSIAGVTGTYEGSGGGSGALDDRTKFWMRAIQNRGVRYDAEGNYIPFVMLKDYWPARLEGYEISSNPGVLSAFRLSEYCCAKLELESVELPKAEPGEPITIPEYAFYFAGQERLINGNYVYMTVTGEESNTYSFQQYAFAYAKLNDIPNINYYGNLLNNSIFHNVTFKSCNVPEGVTTIESSALHSVKVNNGGIVSLPTTLTAINGYGSLSGDYSKHINIVLKSTTPPTLNDSNALQYVDSITVPAGTLETYQTATNWTTFADIMVEATANAGTTEGGA